MSSRAVAALALVAALTAAAPATAGPAESDAGPGSSPGPGQSPGPAANDASLPTGREVAPPRERPDPAAVPVSACSFSEQVCVHAAPSVDPGAALWTLRLAERALCGYRALGVPPPLPDGALGGTPAYDVYLVPSEAAPITVADLVATGDPWDRASAFTILPPPTPRTGCEAGFAIAQGIAHAAGLGLDAGAEAGALSMASSYLASLVAPCANVEIAAVDDFQRHPERSFVAGDPDRPDGALLFPWYLDDTYGRGGPGRVILALLGLAAQQTPPGAWEWNNEPDVFDVLRATMRDRGSTLDDMLLDFAVARAFVGSRSDGTHLADVARYGDAGRVRFEWAVPYGSLPRRLAPGAPIEAMGMTYLWVDLSASPQAGELTFVADWEMPALFRWALVKVDKEGAQVGRVDVAGIFGVSHAERTIVGLDGLAGLLVAGVDAGSVDRSHPFDPDEQPLMPHGYTVTLYP